MSTIVTFIDWLRPFHEGANGATSEAVDAAVVAFDAAPASVRTYVIRQGLRLGLHALRRTATIQVNGDADTMPLFFAAAEPDGTVVHRARSLATVTQARDQLAIWRKRGAEADSEAGWWMHQLELAGQANAEPEDTLSVVWNRLGLSYQLFIGDAAEAEA